MSINATDTNIDGCERSDFPMTVQEMRHQLDGRLHNSASIAAYKGGEQILAFSSGVARNIDGTELESVADANGRHPLFRVFSSGKPMVAAALWRLLDRGIVDINATVSDYWPEFAQNGKSNITVQHVLTHSSGLPYELSQATTDWMDWGRMIDILSSMRAEYEPGRVIHYHTLTFGWLAGEIAARAAGLTFEEVFEREVRSPLELQDTFFTVHSDDHEILSRVAHLSASPDFGDDMMPSKMDWMLVNGINAPGGSCVSSSHGLAKLFSTVANGGRLSNGYEWLSREGAAKVYAVHMRGYEMSDMTEKALGQGVWLSLAQPNSFAAPDGSLAFGHGGMGTTIAWGDPELGLGFSFVSDVFQPDDVNLKRLNRISAAVRRDLGLPVGDVCQLSGEPALS